MSVRVMTDVWSWSQATGTTFLVLLALADVADDQGECWPSIAHLARKCRVSERTVQRCVRDLEDIGEVVVVVGGGRASTPGGTRSNRYRIVIHIPAERGGDRLTGGVTRDGDGVSPVSGGGVSPVSPDPSLLPVIDPSSRAPAPLTPPSRPTPAARRTRAPERIDVTESMRSWATTQPHLGGVDLDHETARMLDHHRARGSAMADWTAAWRTWMGRVGQFGRPSTGSPSRSLVSIDTAVGAALAALPAGGT
ncbi:MAG: helix-turn-helix domain-containing protein [Acidimicrobiales bacterium]